MTCHVCMHDVNDPSTLNCSHVYCHECITTWIGSRRAPLCPVCRAAITGIRRADGTEQAAQPATTEQQDADLSCQDHRYFLGEVQRLLSRANSVHDRLFRDGYCCGRKGGGRAGEAALSGVQELLAVLGSYRSSLEGEVRFDPEVLLADLYRLDRQLSTLSAGGTIDSSDTSAAASGDARAGGWYGSAHHHHHDEDTDEFDGYFDEDDDDGGDWLPKGSALSRTPGRRPTSRHQRSNSQQQQQQRGVQQQQQRGVQQQQQRGVQQQQQRGVQQQQRGKSS